MTDPGANAERLAHKFLGRGDPTGWFEAVYAGANWAEARIPWAQQAVNPGLAEWLGRKNVSGAGRKALVIGCGLGDDAEALAGLGFAVTAFDISATAIEWCRKRFPNSAVHYTVADLFKLPASWRANFDFVLEVQTIQSFPPELHERAIKASAGCVAPGGTLLAICLGYAPPGTYEGPPWPLSRAELAAFKAHGLTEIRFEDTLARHSSRRFRVEYRA